MGPENATTHFVESDRANMANIDAVTNFMQEALPED